MINKTNVYILINISIIMFIVSCASSKMGGKKQNIVDGTWSPQPVIIDGDSKDWPSPYPNYDAKAMVAYATCNDYENLYVTMQTGDELTQMKILKQGMTLSIDTNGKKEAPFHINYPLPNDNDPTDVTTEEIKVSARDATDGRSGRWEKRIHKSADQANQLSIDGFKDCNGGYTIAQTNACGIKVRVRIDEYKELVWEACIPLKSIYGRQVTIADAGKPLGICFAVKGFKKPAEKNTDNNTAGTNMNGSMPSGVGMNSRMNNGSGRQGRPANDPMQQFYETTKTWKFFRIAMKPGG